MITSLHKHRSTLPYRILSGFVAFNFIFSLILPPGYAQLAPQLLLNLPAPGTMVATSAAFTPALINGITIHPENPLKFDFIIGNGDQKLDGKAFEEESTRLIKYFLASLTVPEEEMWVNLSPYEKDRIIPNGFGTTEMGRDLLAQDYILKQLTASLMYPEKELGKKFWDKIYQEAKEKYGTTEIPMNTFNKVWIVPEKAVVYEHGNSAFVVKSHLKVMLEEDYEAMSHQSSDVSHQKNKKADSLTTDDRRLTTEIIREIILPAIEKEVNEGKTFANLRQIYNSVILAAWFKKNLKETLLGQVYVDKTKTKGIDVEDKTVNQKIYEQYLDAFKKGVYNYIKEDTDPATQEVIPRKYFSGGTIMAVENLLTSAQRREIDEYIARQMGWDARKVEVDMLELGKEKSVVAVQEAIASSQRATRDEPFGKLRVPREGVPSEVEGRRETKKASSPIEFRYMTREGYIYALRFDPIGKYEKGTVLNEFYDRQGKLTEKVLMKSDPKDPIIKGRTETRVYHLNGKLMRIQYAQGNTIPQVKNEYRAIILNDLKNAIGNFYGRPPEEIQESTLLKRLGIKSAEDRAFKIMLISTFSPEGRAPEYWNLSQEELKRMATIKDVVDTVLEKKEKDASSSPVALQPGTPVTTPSGPGIFRKIVKDPDHGEGVQVEVKPKGGQPAIVTLFGERAKRVIKRTLGEIPDKELGPRLFFDPDKDELVLDRQPLKPVSSKMPPANRGPSLYTYALSQNAHIMLVHEKFFSSKASPESQTLVQKLKEEINKSGQYKFIHSGLTSNKFLFLKVQPIASSPMNNDDQALVSQAMAQLVLTPITENLPLIVTKAVSFDDVIERKFGQAQPEEKFKEKWPAHKSFHRMLGPDRRDIAGWPHILVNGHRISFDTAYTFKPFNPRGTEGVDWHRVISIDLKTSFSLDGVLKNVFPEEKMLKELRLDDIAFNPANHNIAFLLTYGGTSRGEQPFEQYFIVELNPFNNLVKKVTAQGRGKDAYQDEGQVNLALGFDIDSKGNYYVLMQRYANYAEIQVFNQKGDLISPNTKYPRNRDDELDRRFNRIAIENDVVVLKRDTDGYGDKDPKERVLRFMNIKHEQQEPASSPLVDLADFQRFVYEKRQAGNYPSLVRDSVVLMVESLSKQTSFDDFKFTMNLFEETLQVLEGAPPAKYEDIFTEAKRVSDNIQPYMEEPHHKNVRAMLGALSQVGWKKEEKNLARLKEIQQLFVRLARDYYVQQTTTPAVTAGAGNVLTGSSSSPVKELTTQYSSDEQFVLLSDLTGTLMDKNGVPGQLIAELKRKLEAGAILVVITGDSLKGAQDKFLNKIPSELYPRIIILGLTGMQGYRFQDGEFKKFTHGQDLFNEMQRQNWEQFKAKWQKVYRDLAQVFYGPIERESFSDSNNDIVHYSYYTYKEKLIGKLRFEGGLQQTFEGNEQDIGQIGMPQDANIIQSDEIPGMEIRFKKWEEQNSISLNITISEKDNRRDLIFKVLNAVIPQIGFDRLDFGDINHQFGGPVSVNSLPTIFDKGKAVEDLYKKNWSIVTDLLEGREVEGKNVTYSGDGFQKNGNDVPVVDVLRDLLGVKVHILNFGEPSEEGVANLGGGPQGLAQALKPASSPVTLQEATEEVLKEIEDLYYFLHDYEPQLDEESQRKGALAHGYVLLMAVSRVAETIFEKNGVISPEILANMLSNTIGPNLGFVLNALNELSKSRQETVFSADIQLQFKERLEKFQTSANQFNAAKKLILASSPITTKAIKDITTNYIQERKLPNNFKVKIDVSAGHSPKLVVKIPELDKTHILGFWETQDNRITAYGYTEGGGPTKIFFDKRRGKVTTKDIREAVGTFIDNVVQGEVSGSSSPVSGDEIQATKREVGGINLNPELLDLQIKRDGNGVPLPLPQQPIQDMHIEGFLPVIINVTPITNLPLLLGLADTAPDSQATNTTQDLKAREVEPVSLLN